MRMLLLVVSLLLWLPTAALASFPEPDCIKPNVAFWRDIFGRYPSTQGLLHDSNDLAVIYQAIEVENSWEAAARKRNKAKVDAAREKYRAMLLALAGGAAPAGAEEQRVLAMFGPDPGAERLRAAAANIRFQQGQQDRFREGVIRSGAYLGRIKRIFREHGLPEELAYLPHVESSFNYQAYSKAGAAGIWQFMRATGARYMTIDYVVDERRDPIAATRAAALFLRENYEKLGDWPLAITAYNHGANGMLRAKAQHGDYETIFRQYDGGYFKFASRNFYPEFLAAVEVAKNASRYFGELRLEPPLSSHELTLTGYLPLQELAAHLNIDHETLRRYNPALREPVFQGRKHLPKGYRLRLPDRPEYARLAATGLPADLLRPQQQRSNFYMVQSGDTAGAIARRHNISLQELIAANQLGNRATVYAGQNLRLPGRGEPPTRLAQAKTKEKAGAAVAAKVVEQRMAALEPQVPPPTKVAAVARPSLPEPPKAVAVPNKAPDKVPAAISEAQVNPAVVSGHLQVERVWQDKGGGSLYGIIRVEVEETLGHYAEWLGIRAQELRRLNGLNFGRTLRLDQTLKIPLAQVDRAGFEERRYEFHKEQEEDFFAAFKVEGVREHRVKKGDNIWELCRLEFDLPLWLIRKYNPELDLNALSPGLSIQVPLVESLS